WSFSYLVLLIRKCNALGYLTFRCDPDLRVLQIGIKAKVVHITPPDDDYVAPATSPALDKQLNKFGKECFDITRVTEMAYGNPVKDKKKLSDII
ncbi:hypothetical protein Tco_1280973, partial [Tanacetum coccineum]